jgi:hypothetical protein
MMTGEGSNGRVSRTMLLMAIQISRKEKKVIRKVQLPPKVAILSARRWPKISCQHVILCHAFKHTYFESCQFSFLADQQLLDVA